MKLIKESKLNTEKVTVTKKTSTGNKEKELTLEVWLRVIDRELPKKDIEEGCSPVKYQMVAKQDGEILQGFEWSKSNDNKNLVSGRLADYDEVYKMLEKYI